MNGHLTPFSEIKFVGEALVGKLIQGKAAPHEETVFPILSENVVLLVQRRRGSHMNGLFPSASHVKANAALSLSIVKNRVHGSKPNNLTMRSQERIG
jgi:hypothetical protein